jgi:hypothetical protein
MIDTRPEYTFAAEVRDGIGIQRVTFVAHTHTEAKTTARRYIKSEYGIVASEGCISLYQFTSEMNKVLIAKREDGKWSTVWTA